MIIEIDNTLAFEILDVLRLTPVYALLGSEFEAELGEPEYDFKAWKWRGYEKEHAELSARCHRELLNAMRDAVGLDELSPPLSDVKPSRRGSRSRREARRDNAD